MLIGDLQLYIDTRTRYRAYARNALLRSWVVLIPASLVTFLGLLLLGVSGSVYVVGGGYLAVGIAGFLWLMYTYGVTTVIHEDPPATISEVLKNNNEDLNIGDALTWSGVEVLGSTRGEVVVMEDIVHRLLQHKDVQAVLAFLGVTSYEQLLGALLPVVRNMAANEFMYTAGSQAASRGQRYISAVDLLGTFLLHPDMYSYLRSCLLRERDVTFALWWWSTVTEIKKASSRWWEAGQLLGFTGVGLSWAAGYTPFLDSFMRVPAGNIWDQPYGHGDQVEQLVTSLARARQSNVLLVGQPGVGRLGVVKELAARMEQQQAHPALDGQRVAYVNIGQLLALGSTGAEQLQYISRALTEMEKAGNIIAVLDGLGSILGGSGEQRVNFSDVIMPFFSSESVRVVVIMSVEDYHERFKDNEELGRVFEVVQVPALSDKQTLELLALTKEVWEKDAGVQVSYPVLREVVEVTSSIMPYVPFPEKAFDILDELVVQSQKEREVIITSEDVRTLISRKTGIQVGKISGLEGRHLLHLEEFIHRRVVNQKQGVAAVAKAMVRSRAGVRDTEQPIGTFLFMGPTGVGKTETAKALAEAFFGSDAFLQRLDMTEFQGEQGVQQLIGGGTHKTGRLTSLIADHPYSVLLLDEFEKASQLVKQVFLPIFDEGYVTDAYGHRYSFRNTIIIATSNAGAEYIRTNVRNDGSMPAGFTDRLQEHVLSEGEFRPEELNRFDGVITFTPLSQEHIRQITIMMLQKLNKRLDAEHGTAVDISDTLVSYLMSIGYDPEFGARPMARAIQDTVEYAVARRIASGMIRPGTRITIDPAELEKNPA